MRALVGAGLLVILALTGGVAWADTCSATAGGTVNLRGGPGTGYAVLGTLSGSTSLVKTGEAAAGSGCSGRWMALTWNARTVYACGSLLVCRQGPLSACNLQGRFRAIVERVLGAERARTSASYGLMIVQKQSIDGAKGPILCEEYSAGDLAIVPASTIKTLVAVAVLRKVDAGLARMTDLVTINQVNAAAECRDWGCGTYGPGKKVQLSKLVSDMITISNNLATNQLIDFAGKPFIAETAQKLEARGVALYRKVYSIQNPEPNIQTPNQSTAYGMARIYREVATGRLGVLSETNRAWLIEILRRQVYHDRLDKLFPQSVTFYHKVGSTSSLSGDAGFYNLGGNTIVVLVGHQGFLSFPTLQQVGKQALDLTQSLR
jgi:hypothetical protein